MSNKPKTVGEVVKRFRRPMPLSKFNKDFEYIVIRLLEQGLKYDQIEDVMKQTLKIKRGKDATELMSMGMTLNEVANEFKCSEFKVSTDVNNYHLYLMGKK